MNIEKNIVYTESGKRRLDSLIERLSKDVESELIQRKRVPGDEEIEVTGSDVDEIARSIRITFLGAHHYRLVARDLIVKAYLGSGIVMLAAGLLYPYIRYWRDDPIQAMLILTGLLMTAASYSLKTLVDRRKDLEDVLSRVKDDSRPSVELEDRQITKR
jgi:hypothetical protein